MIDTGANGYFVVLSVDITSVLNSDPGITMFVVDTGANGVIFGRPLHEAGLCSALQTTPGRYVNSNDHRDEVLGTATLHCRFACANSTTIDVPLAGLVTPSSRWSILPPSLVPGFDSATISSTGTISLLLSGGQVLVTVPFQGLQVLFFAPLASPQPAALANPVSERTPKASPSLVISPPASDTLVRLHQTLAHAGASTIHRLVRDGVVACADPATKASLLASSDLACKHCAAAANASKPKSFPDRHLPSAGSPGVWSTDLFGPLALSVGGCRYGCILVCHRHKYHFFAPLRSKADFVEWFSAGLPRFEAESKEQVAVLRSDNGGEFVNSALDSLCASLGIVHQTTAPNSSFQNGVAERAIRTHRHHGGASLSRSGLPHSYWAEAVAHSVYVQNRLPSSGGLPSPFESAHGTIPSLRLVHPFGALALAKNYAARKSSLVSASRKCVVLGPARLAPKTASKSSTSTPTLPPTAVTSNTSTASFPSTRLTAARRHCWNPPSWWLHPHHRPLALVYPPPPYQITGSRPSTKWATSPSLKADPAAFLLRRHPSTSQALSKLSDATTKVDSPTSPLSNLTTRSLSASALLSKPTPWRNGSLLHEASCRLTAKTERGRSSLRSPLVAQPSHLVLFSRLSMARPAKS